MVISQVCQCLVLALSYEVHDNIFSSGSTRKALRVNKWRVAQLVSFCKHLMCLDIKCQSGASWILHAFQVHFSPKQKLIWSHAQGKRARPGADHPVDPNVASSELRTLFTIPSVLAVHVLLEPSFELSQLVLGSVDHLWSGKQVSAAHAVIN